MKENTYTNLALRYLSDELSNQEKATFKAWLHEDPSNQVKFDEIKSIWQQSEADEPEVIPDRNKTWTSIEAELDVLPEETKDITFWRRGRVVASLAAAAILLLALGLFSYMSVSEATDQVFITQNGERLSIPLPDGSTVLLNSGSRLIWENDSPSENREVTLVGQAYFDVVSDGRPFSIRTENAYIQVLGTQFDVRARNNATRVIVMKGRVAVQSAGDTQEDRVILNQNEMTLCMGDRPPQSPRSINASYAIGWLERKLVFDKTPLSEIVAELRRIYNIRIELPEPDIGRLTITGVFDQADAEAVIKDVCTSLELEYSFDGNTYTITR